MKTLSPNTPSKPSRLETKIVILLLGVFVLLSAISMTHTPKIFMDEVIDSDVAAHLYRGQGYTSNADPIARSGQFLIAHPTYHLMLAGWFRVFGLGIWQSRSFDVALIGIAGLIFWAGAFIRYGPRPWLPRICMLALLWFADEFVRSYRGHRYDQPCMLWFSCLYLASVSDRPFARYLTIALLCALLPLTSFNGVILCGMIMIGCLFIPAHAGRKNALSMGLGLCIGLLLYATLLGYNGRLWGLVDRLTQYSSGAAEDISWAAMSLRGIKWGKTGLLLTAILSTVVLKERRHLGPRKAIVWVLLALIGIPCVLSFVGRYSYYYVWTTALMVILLITHAFSTQPIMANPSYYRLLAGITVVACLLGLPARIAEAIPDWSSRNYQTIEQFVNGQIDTNDVVLCDSPPYYPVAERARQWYFTAHFRGMSAEEKHSVSVVFLSPEEGFVRNSNWEKDLFSELGGVWQKVQELSVPRGALRMRIPPAPKETTIYDIRVYRRIDPSALIWNP